MIDLGKRAQIQELLNLYPCGPCHCNSGFCERDADIIAALIDARAKTARRCKEIARTANRRHGELVHPNDIADDIEKEFGRE